MKQAHRWTWTTIVILLTAALLSPPALAGMSIGHLDTGFDPGTGADDLVNAIAVQADGKVLIAGRFGDVDSTTRQGIARLNSDGSHDTVGFGGMTGADGTIAAMALQPNGYILIGGAFTSYDGTPRNRIARLDGFGSVDSSFDPGTGANDGVNAIAIQPDGKIIIAGAFTSYDGTPRSRIARLNADGSLDTSFDPGTGPDAGVVAVALQSDGKVLIGGYFDRVNGLINNFVARLNADGSRDSSFNGSANAVVRDLAVQPDGKIVMVGDFTGAVGASLKHIARMNSDGIRDTGFDPGLGADDYIRAVHVQPDGKIVIGGYFQFFDGYLQNRAARLNADGSVDFTFRVGSLGGANNPVLAVAQQVDGKVLFGGSFTQFHGITYGRIVRVHVDATLDDGLDAGAGPGGVTYPGVYAAVAQDDGKILVGGDFTTFAGAARSRAARLRADGSLDSAFTTSGGGPNGVVRAMALQDDGKIIVGGHFDQVDGTSRNNIARLNADGSLDASFDPGTGANESVYAVVLQPDGKVLIGGFFTTVDGVSRNHVARLNTNGSLDSGFDPGTGADGNVYALARLDSGKVMIAGAFANVDNVGRVRVARLNASGSLDTAFDPGTGPNSTVQSMAVQPDNKVLIGGIFTTVAGTSRNRIARLNDDGALDSGFDPGTGFNSGVLALWYQEDGNVLAGGGFTLYNGAARFRIARLLANGSLDTGFFPGSGPNDLVRAIALQPGAKVVIGGDFSTFGGATANGVTRLNGASPVTLGDPYPPDGKVNEAYTHAFTSRGFPVPTYHIVDGSLPPGLSLDAESGVLSGTPTAAGDYDFEVWAINGVITNGSATCSMTVAEADTFFIYLPVIVRP